MTALRTSDPKPSAAADVLTCRLRPALGRRSPSPLAGEVELENTSTAPVEIEVRASPLQYLDLIVTDAAGQVVSDYFYGIIFSPTEKPFVFRLAPGEKYTHPVALLGNVPKELQRTGRYVVQAIFDCGTCRAISELFVVEIPELA